ncbi:MAG TPA: Eco57I restriction-modification methylase domain-containing protein [Candidatus Wujingus californicus]|uniref:Eco57I restriction-modification methylase domain-containing protein n=1 Tax=Candidatus Wujingus californicus TaxID=3367618 RepID=UPI001DE3386C|nr:Eco57I restriction-modification methylase domain-containing protein [Planctomycetota bacterium]MDO8094873.1 TaqI-like C-terminal specificity domain-containing protein [Candidatus Brocadiales bacterium]MDO8130505.1 TaqI-like C-terminal specificity domain-containing protein [Candidatus Brocadiales bacterium]
MPEQEKPVWNNQNLFSNNYLEHRLLSTSFLGDKEKGIEEVFEAVKNTYKKSTVLNLGTGEEAGLEDKFIRPVLKILGYEWDVQPTTERGAKKKRPDYALFKDKPSLENARKEKDNLKRFFSHPLTILEAKYWGRRLNDADPKDTLDRRDPTAQTVKYLDDVYHASEGRIQWAILTNGKQWRLFYNRASSRSGNFYEIDLEEIIQSNNLDTFKYFYLFFAKNAFIPEPLTGKTLLDQHLKGSEDYATRISEKLKELIFDRIFECLATGFIEYRRIESGIKKETDETLKEIFNGCLTLLYRLLFLLYAESRSLLPVNEQDRYYKKSLKKIKEDIARDLETTGIEGMSHKAYDYWSRLESLCRIIDKGDKALNIPIYNGGLFETPQGSFLTANKISDPLIAQAIDLLTVDLEGEYTPGQKPFIDYSSLSVRHLGDIYEGLLEFHVRIADEPMIEVKEKGKFLWKKKSEIKAGDKICSSILEKGDVYIENSKHERKATGSYYTPHYIVEYIVKNTVCPVLEERFEKAKGILSELEVLYERQRKQLKKPNDWKHWEHPGEPKGSHIDEIVGLEKDLFETVFDIKVLDPAMGSGHFLVHTVDFITDRIITFLADYPENPVIRRINEMKREILEEIARQGVKIDETKLTEVNLIKRTVMKRCIYGADLNEMAVELAKLSLWLDSFTLGAPLSFLDHHLKCGNSLIGTNLEVLRNAIKGQLFTINLEPLNRAIRNMLFVSSLSDATYQQVKDSERKYRDADKSIGGYRILLDVLVSEYFGTEGAKSFLLEKGSFIDLDNLKKSIDSMYKKDRETIEFIEKIAKEKRFFHWDIEFPEVFFERVGALEQKVEKKENSGFDCVIGNPPYGVMFDSYSKTFFNKKYISAEYQLESFALFIEQAILLLKQNGFHSFITPTTWLSMHYYENLRSFLLGNNRLKQIIFFKEPVFKDATVETCIEIVERNKPDTKSALKLGIVASKPENMNIKFVEIVQKKVERFAEKRITEYLTPKSLDLFEKIQKTSFPLKDIASLIVGCKPYQTGKGTPHQTKSNVENRIYDADFKKDDTYKPYIRGEDFYRFDLNLQENRWISYGEWLAEPRPSAPFFAPKKIVIRQTADSIIATIDDKQYLNLNNVHNLILNVENYSLEFILAMLNSKLLSFIHTMIVPEYGRVFAEVKIVNLEKLPIPCIDFITPIKTREGEVVRFKSHYQASKYDDIIADVEACLSEKSDVTHDLLAYLAEQMIEMSKKKNEEIKGFLKWLEREIGAEIDSLANKTAIKEYHETDFNQFLEVLKKNRNKVSIDPSDRKIQELLERHYTKSMSILKPLKTRIKATDELIDEIVYRLYGLTEKEIEVVKGAVF